ncbi:MAG: NUDIX hydrolase [Patescibacteria group bacterium]|nr:NUDIX domain-containing protein [Patescibacteria group bacterium]MDE2015218.1 NUDIX hydrolase [Patescibacteria group bacterium]MDE2227024.1 NUDIX hydrolase [Patescibacteria group bacterium]
MNEKIISSNPGQAVAVLIITPQGIPLIRDPKKPSPVYWKAPGGRGSGAESAEEVALREIREEIGIKLKKEDLSAIYREDKGSHILTMFRADLPALPQLKTRGDEGEEIKVFLPKDIMSMPDFFSNHRAIYGKIIGNL